MTLNNFVDVLRFCHLLTGQRKCHPYEGCNVEPAGTGQDSSAQQRSGIPASHRPGRRDHGSQRTPHQASPRRLPQGRSRRAGPREPGPKAPQRRPRDGRCCRGEAGQQRLRRRQPQPLHRAAAGAGGHRPEPPYGAPRSWSGPVWAVQGADVRSSTGSGAVACPSRGCWCRSTAVNTPGWRTGGPS